MKDNCNVNEDVEKINTMISKINEAARSGNKNEINDMVNQIYNNLQNLYKNSRKDEILYRILIILNKIASTNPSYRNSACQTFDDSLIAMVKNTKFEKMALKNIKKYLATVRKTKDCDNLSLSFIILVSLLGMQTVRDKKISEDIDVWRSGISGIRYVPAEKINDNYLSTFEKDIEKKLSKLNNVK